MAVSSLSGETNEALKLKVDSQPVSEINTAAVVSYADVLEAATPSVVAVYTSRYVPVYERRGPMTLQDLLRQYYSQQQPNRSNREPQTREELERVGVGSGVIVSENGYIVTNRHVVTDPRGEVVDEIRVRLNNDREYVAELVGADDKTDVAVLKIENEDALPSVTVADSSLLRVGDVVFAIGNPLEVGLTATQGIVSATGRNSLGVLGRGGYEDFIQTDAAINPGNSGGALIDARGRLIGINTAIVSGTGGNIGIGLAIPSNLVLNVMTNLIENGEVPRGLLGLFPENVSLEMAEYLGLDSTHGALVNQVQPDSPAEKGGILHGDVIIKVDDTVIVSAPQLRLVISQTLPGTEVEIELVREGKVITRSVTLGSLSGKVASKEKTSGLEVGVLEGVSLEAMTPELRKTYAVPESVNGIVVTNVAYESPYADLMMEGMVISEVNGQTVRSVDELQSSLKKGSNRLYTWAGETMRFVLLRMK